MIKCPTSIYDNPRLAEIYDLDSGWSMDRDFYLSLTGSTRQKILDLGCGTGLICDAYAAKNHDVTGVDPSAAMLRVARQKPHGKKIKWIQSFAQTYHSDKFFDLIIMTGHAFQVLLEDSEIQATFAVMRRLRVLLFLSREIRRSIGQKIGTMIWLLNCLAALFMNHGDFLAW